MSCNRTWPYLHSHALDLREQDRDLKFGPIHLLTFGLCYVRLAESIWLVQVCDIRRISSSPGEIEKWFHWRYSQFSGMGWDIRVSLLGQAPGTTLFLDVGSLVRHEIHQLKWTMFNPARKHLLITCHSEFCISYHIRLFLLILFCVLHYGFLA